MVSQTNSWLWSWSRFWPWCFRHLSRSLVWPGPLVLVLLLFLIFVLVQVQVTGLFFFFCSSAVSGYFSWWWSKILIMVHIFVPVLFCSWTSLVLVLVHDYVSAERLKRFSRSFSSLYADKASHRSEPVWPKTRREERCWKQLTGRDGVPACFSSSLTLCGGDRKPGGTNLAAHRFHLLCQQQQQQ